MPSIQTIKPSRLLNGQTRRIQGINSKIDDVKLLGQSFKAAIDQAIVEPGIELNRGIDLSSTLTIPVHDPDRDLWNSKLLEARFDLELDDLWFRFMAANPEGDLLTLTCEAREVAKLRRHFGPESAVRGKVTRAEFVVGLWRKALANAAIYCPELHTRQPIKTERAAREDDAERDIRRDKGVDAGAHLTVKGAKATAAQIAAGDKAMRIAESYGAGDEVLTGLMMALINETAISDPAGGLADSAGWLQLQASDHPGVDPHSLPVVVKLFVKEGFTGAGSALELSKRYPLAEWVGKVMWMNSATTYPGARYEDEAREWVSAFGGGDISSISVTSDRDFKFTCAPIENYWDCAGRLGSDVNWRRFEAAGVLYFIAETDLLKSRPRMRVRRGAPGIDDISGDFNLGKKVNELTVNARVRDWAAPPGSVAIVEDEGPASGRYIVSNIRTILGRSAAEITLKRPTQALPEPAAETKTTTIDFGSAGDTGGGTTLEKMIAEADRIDSLHKTYVYGGGHVTPAPANGPWDCSSAVSRVLQVGGYDIPTMVSGDLAAWGEPGKGKAVTIYADSGHVLMSLNGRFWGTSRENPGGGPGWISQPSASYLAAKTARHPKGL